MRFAWVGHEFGLGVGPVVRGTAAAKHEVGGFEGTSDLVTALGGNYLAYLRLLRMGNLVHNFYFIMFIFLISDR